jgi:2-amino-4-hydroxy-6-hydroxymethyldihydropteridine diphosphokinase
MKPYKVFLGLGSNLGDRAAFLQGAVDALKQVNGVKVVWCSSVYDTEPYGRKDQAAFLNAAVEIETALSPAELFPSLKRIEHQIGRTSSERWGPREIDIDLLLYDGLVYEDDHLKVPHPELARRKFVLIPLREIAPDLIHPVSGYTVEDLAQSSDDTSRVVRSIHRLLL